MDFNALNDGCVVIGRCGRADVSGVRYEEPRQYSLRIHRDPKGRVALVSVQGARNFIEFDPRHDADGSELISEDYYFEVIQVINNPSNALSPSDGPSP